MVGRAVSEYCNSAGDRVFAYDRQHLDIADRDGVMSTLQRDKPDTVINCAAWTDVDGCELHKERAFQSNAVGPENLAIAARECDAVLVTISTDYVFDGRKKGFYTQRDQPNPESIYGMTKLDGERRAQQAHARTIIARTGFVFGSWGRNFLSTIVERARRGEKLSAITDAYGTPTYARDLAIRLRELAELDLPGTFHVVNAGSGTSYEEFGRLSLAAAGLSNTEFVAVKMDQLQRPAPRPINSRLRCLLSEAIGLSPLPFWEDAVKDFVAFQSPAEMRAKR